MGVQLVCVVERAARMDAPRVGLDPPAMATLGILLGDMIILILYLCG